MLPNLNDARRARARRSSASTFVDDLDAFFRARVGQWVDGLSISRVAGLYAWRTRVSDVRLRFRAEGGDIANRLRRVETADGQTVTVSEYRAELPRPTIPDSVPAATGSGLLFDLHTLTD
jgi:hypothetical protein